jgi:hypothetical protein
MAALALCSSIEEPTASSDISRKKTSHDVVTLTQPAATERRHDIFD